MHFAGTRQALVYQVNGAILPHCTLIDFKSQPRE